MGEQQTCLAILAAHWAAHRAAHHEPVPPDRVFSAHVEHADEQPRSRPGPGGSRTLGSTGRSVIRFSSTVFHDAPSIFVNRQQAGHPGDRPENRRDRRGPASSRRGSAQCLIAGTPDPAGAVRESGKTGNAPARRNGTRNARHGAIVPPARRLREARKAHPPHHDQRTSAGFRRRNAGRSANTASQARPEALTKPRRATRRRGLAHPPMSPLRRRQVTMLRAARRRSVGSGGPAWRLPTPTTRNRRLSPTSQVRSQEPEACVAPAVAS